MTVGGLEPWTQVQDEPVWPARGRRVGPTSVGVTGRVGERARALGFPLLPSCFPLWDISTARK